MINLRNKPVTLFIALPVIGIGILSGVGYLLYLLIYSFSVINPAGLGVVILLPAILFYALQIVAYVVMGYFILLKLSRWSHSAIIASVLICPSVLAVLVALIAGRSGFTLNLSRPIGVGILIGFLLMYLAVGVIAYNDIRYRQLKSRI